MEIKRLKTLMECIKKVQLAQTYDFIAPHPRNRKINDDAVRILSLLLNDKDAIFLPIFVVKASNEDRRLMDNKKIKYLIVDGQHRFESAKEETFPYLYIDVTDYFLENGKVNSDKVAKTVDALNIGVRAYDNKTLKEKNQNDAFLSYYNDLVKDVELTVSKTNKYGDVQYKVVDLSKKCTEEFVIGATKIKRFRKSKYRSGDKLTKDEKESMNKAVKFYKATIDGMSGYFYDPSYQFRDFVHSFVTKVELGDVDSNLFYQKWTDFLKDKYQHINTQNKREVYDEMFSLPSRDFVGNIFNEFLEEEGVEYEVEKDKYINIINIQHPEMA
jgi:hypothetical protein